MSTSTVLIQKSEVVMSSDYISLLEKAENVHSIGLTLASVLIGLLSLILTIAGIVAAYLMWKNNKDQKEERMKVRERYNEDLENAQNNYNSKLEELLGYIQKQAEKRIEELGASSSATSDKIQELKDELLEIKKATVNAVKLDNNDYSLGLSFEKNKAKVCDKCGKYYSPSIFENNSLSLNYLGRKNLCKECSLK